MFLDNNPKTILRSKKKGLAARNSEFKFLPDVVYGSSRFCASLNKLHNIYGSVKLFLQYLGFFLDNHKWSGYFFFTNNSRSFVYALISIFTFPNISIDVLNLLKIIYIFFESDPDRLSGTRSYGMLLRIGVR